MARAERAFSSRAMMRLMRARAVFAAALLAFSAFAPADAHPPFGRLTSATTRRTRRSVSARTPRPWRTRASPSAWPGPPPTVASIPRPTRTISARVIPEVRARARSRRRRSHRLVRYPSGGAYARRSWARARILTTVALLPSVPDPQARHITTAEYKPGARHTLTVYTPVEGEFILTASAGAFEDFGQRLGASSATASASGARTAAAAADTTSRSTSPKTTSSGTPPRTPRRQPTSPSK